MLPRVLVAYSTGLFAEGLTRLLADRDDCALSGVRPLDALRDDDLAADGPAVVILEGDDADPAMLTAMRRVIADRAALAMILVNLNVPTLRVCRLDTSVRAGLDELTAVVREVGARVTPVAASGGSA